MSVAIVGLGTGCGLTSQATSAIGSASLLIGGTRQLALAAPHSPNAAQWDLTGRLKQIAPTVADAVQNGQSVAIVASGDPLFYGIGSYLFGKLADAGIVPSIHPAPSAIAVAAARLGWKWNDALVHSCHGRPIGNVVGLLRRHGKMAIYTDETNSPRAIGELLRDSGVTEGTAHIAEALGTERERLQTLPVRELHAIDDVDPLNVLLLEAPPVRQATVPFEPDDSFEKKMPKKGLITKREIRVLSMAALGVGAGDVCWDLGAGSGAIAIDMMRCGASGVWAVEKNADGCAIITENVSRFGAGNVHVVHAKAPDGLEALPDPDRVFIGGSAGQMNALIEIVLQRLRPGGTLVINVATVENLALALAKLRALDAPHDCTQAQISRSKTILGRLTRFEALNPIQIVRAMRPGEELQ
jgi:precorrin-6Y C5,15-methyltransferase (decarboxylating)